MEFNAFTRRAFIKSAAGAATVALLPTISLAGNPTGKKLHGLSAFGDLKYPPDYPHFDYAALDAPKGGTFAFAPSNWALNQNIQTFNTLNTFVLKGDAPPRMGLCFNSLMGSAIDEPDSIYGALAKTVEISDDRNTYRFELHDIARFHDGSDLTARDVAFSYQTIKEKGHPQMALDLRHMVRAEAVSDYVFELEFNGDQSDRAILSVATIVPILSEKYYTEHEFDASTLEPPLGSGGWKVKEANPGSFIIYERHKDYWGKDLPFALGSSHFDFLRIDFFRDRTAAFEAFKKGLVTWRQEFTSKVWATEYDFPAVKEGKVVQREFPAEKRPSMQAWAVNSRKKKFSDPRVRQAIGYCFDFEWTNRNIFFDAYTRSQSSFERSDFKAVGKPGADELALLEPLREIANPAVFEDPYLQFETNGTGNDRRIFRQALKLLKQAGFKSENGKQVSPDGEQLTIEFMIRSPTFERILGKYVQNLGKIGIDASIRLVDPSQYQARLEDFEFDMAGAAFSIGATPTAESLRQFFHSESVDRKGSRNYPGVAIPALDRLIEQIGLVNSREELVTYMKCIDRVLRAEHYWLPQYYSNSHRVAMWDMFGWKDPKPDYAFPVESIWWFDEAKARKIGKA